MFGWNATFTSLFFFFFFGSHYWFAATVKLHGYNQRPSKSFLHACRGCAVQPRDKTLHQWDQTRFATIWPYWKTLFNHLSASHRLQFTQDSQSSSRHEKRRFIHIISSWFRLKSYLLGVAGAHLIKCCGNGWSAVVERPRFVSWADTQTSEGIRKLVYFSPSQNTVRLRRKWTSRLKMVTDSLNKLRGVYSQQNAT